MKKFIASINRPSDHSIYSICLIATMLCGVQTVTGIARMAGLIYRFFTVEKTDTISYFDMLSGDLVLPPTVPELVIQLLLTAVPACLCVLSFRGLSRPVQGGSLISAGVCLLAFAAITLFVMPGMMTLGAGFFAATCVAVAALSAAAVLLMARKGSNIVIVGLLAVFFISALALNGICPIQPLDAAAAGLGAVSVLLASQDPKMA